MNDPNITQSKIAKQLDRSQPTIGIRMKSLEERGLLYHAYGVNGRVTDIFKVVKLEMTHNKPKKVMALAKSCPFMINAIKQSGKYNILLLMASPGLKKINFIIEKSIFF